MTDIEIELGRLADRLDVLEDKPPGIDGMTLAQLEAMAARLGAAAKTIRDAQALLGGGRVGPTAGALPTAALTSGPDPEAAPLDAIAAHRMRQFAPPELAPSGGGGLRLSPAELAAKRGLMNQFGPRVVDPGLPDDIREMEEGT